MTRVQTMVQLTGELVELLDREAARRGLSRSAVIREALNRYVAEAREDSITRAIVEGYRRIPPGTPDEWGSVEAQSDLATGELLQRLEAEERAGGHGPC